MYTTILLFSKVLLEKKNDNQLYIYKDISKVCYVFDRSMIWYVASLLTRTHVYWKVLKVEYKEHLSRDTYKL